MVKDPNVDSMMYQAEQQEKYEARLKPGMQSMRQASQLSALSQGRMRHEVPLPQVLGSGDFKLTAIKRYLPHSQLVESKILEQFPDVHNDDHSSHFIEI